MPNNIAGVCRLFCVLIYMLIYVLIYMLIYVLIYVLIDDSKHIGVHCLENRFDRRMLDFSLVGNRINLLGNL